MPELPEVETIRRNLEKHLCGETIVAISDPTHSRALRYQVGGISRLRDAVVGQEISGVARRGKFLWMEFSKFLQFQSPDSEVCATSKSDSPIALCFHLGMSGQLRLIESTAEKLRHERLRFVFNNGQALAYCDQRTFGHVELRLLAPTEDGYPGGIGTTQAWLPAGLEHIARDVLDPHLDREQVLEKLHASRRAIKTKLLDQGLVSGIGNIYADEGLFASKILPQTPARLLSRQDASRLLNAVANVMRHALDFGGTSFDSLYVNSWGNPGEFASELNVYGRAGKPCRRCGEPLDKIVIDGRSAVFCAHCEPTVSKLRKARNG